MSMKNKNIYDLYKILSSSSISKKEILQTFNIKTPTFYKYLKIFKKSGFKIARNKEIYRIIGYSNSVGLSSAECAMLAYLMLLSYTFFPVSKTEHIFNIVDKMLELTNEQTKQNVLNKFEMLKKAHNQNIYKEKIEIFEKYKNLNIFLEVTLNSGQKLTLKPDRVLYRNKRIYLDFIDNEQKTKKSLNINNIVKLSPQTNTTELKKEISETVFELYGRLAKTYLLKEGERVVDNFPDKLIIANRTSDKKLLFKRLLRYDTLCRIKFPKNDVIEFEKIISKSLENIGQINDNIQEGKNYE